MGKVIGIDLGTTNSCVALIEANPEQGGTRKDITIVPNAEGARTTPSYVAFTKTGEQLVGQVAKRQSITNPENTVYAIKRLMGRKFKAPEVAKQIELAPYKVVEVGNGDAWVHANDRDYSPPEISAMVLQTMKEIAESFAGETITEAVITVPAYFDDAQRQATKDAGKIAGLDVQRIINEPTAAALAYGLDRTNSERIAVYDLGGGTFDISVLEISQGVFSVKSTGGDTHLGGENFDERIIDHLADEFFKENAVDLRKDRMALQRLKEAAERAKHELSSSLETEINLPFIAVGKNGPLHIERSFKRSELEIWTHDLVDRTIEVCSQTLKDANITPKDIHNVVLVGGMTRMPVVQKAVRNFFEKEPHKGVNPDEVVAMGAAIQAAALNGTMEEVLLLDVTPLSVGVETGGGVFTKVILRNTTIPTEQSEIFTTSVDNQNFVPIHVLQGEREMATDNRSLAQFELTGIPPAPRGVPKIKVTFRLDANGILSVAARDEATGRNHSIQVTPTSGLSTSQIDKIISEGEKFRETDSLRRQLAELKNQSETLLYTTEQAIDGYVDLLDPVIVEEIRRDIETLRSLLEGGGDINSLRTAYQSLESAAFRIAESMYADP
jgi:molecular chaperone DnaK